MTYPTDAHETAGEQPAASGVPVSAPATAAVEDADEAVRRAPGRPRSAQADQAIIEAVLDLLAEGTTPDALSMEQVAARAGVGKATIYRRWPNKEHLLVDALRTLKGPIPEVTGESIREDLLILLRPMATPKSTQAGRILPCLIPELQRNEELARLYHKIGGPRRDAMRKVLEDGIARGELRADIDIVTTMAMIVGPLIAHSTFGWNPDLDMEKLPERMVNSILPTLLA